MNPNDYRRYIAYLCHQDLPRWMHRFHDPDDMIQDVLLSILRSKNPVDALGWVKRVTKNKIINAVRDAWRQKEVTLLGLLRDEHFPGRESEPFYQTTIVLDETRDEVESEEAAAKARYKKTGSRKLRKLACA